MFRSCTTAKPVRNKIYSIKLEAKFIDVCFVVVVFSILSCCVFVIVAVVVFNAKGSIERRFDFTS